MNRLPPSFLKSLVSVIALGGVLPGGAVSAAVPSRGLVVDATTVARLREYGRFATPDSQPAGLTFDGQSLFHTSITGFRRVYRLAPETGEVLDTFLAPGPTGFDGRGNPSGIAAGRTDSLFVADLGQDGRGAVYEIDREGTRIFVAVPLSFRPSGIAFDGEQLYLSDQDDDRVFVLDPDSLDGQPTRSFRTPTRVAGIAYDVARRSLWMIALFDSQLIEMTTDGEVLRLCLSPRQAGPQGLGGVAVVGPELLATEVLDPDPVSDPVIPGAVLAFDPSELACWD